MSLPDCLSAPVRLHLLSNTTCMPIFSQEGRKIWETILSVSRNLSRMISLYKDDIGSQESETILKLVAAFPYLLRHHIRSDSHFPTSSNNNNNNSDDQDATDNQDSITIPAQYCLRLHEPSVSSSNNRPRFCVVDRRHLPWSLLSPRALEHISKTHNRPLWTLDRISAAIMKIPYGPNFTSRERLTLLGMTDQLSNGMGACERIHQTAVPLNYARHALRSLTVWLFTLPFALVRDLGYLTAPVIGSAAWVLYGIYQIGYSIEDPFQGSLRLSILCDSIRHDVLSVMQRDERGATHRRSALTTDDAERFSAAAMARKRLIQDNSATHPLQLVPLNRSSNATTWEIQPQAPDWTSPWRP
jgi:predicted membrane chloride channel (bestrophin family)